MCETLEHCLTTWLHTDTKTDGRQETSTPTTHTHTLPPNPLTPPLPIHGTTFPANSHRSGEGCFHPHSGQNATVAVHQFGPKVLPGIFFGYALNAGGMRKRDILVADIEELEQMDASEIHARRLNAKEKLTPMKNEKFVFPVEYGEIDV